MILAIAATEMEMAPFVADLDQRGHSCRTLVTGVGPVETAVRLTRYLGESEESFEGVFVFGVGGCYVLPESAVQPRLLDICLAEQEVAGDFGICLGEAMDYLDDSLTGDIVWSMDTPLLERCSALLAQAGSVYHRGVFITVSGITATKSRGEMLRSRWNGLCENMEGAAVARVCREFHLPCAELRCISNYVLDRDPSKWQLADACQKAAVTAAQLIKGMAK